MKKKWLILSLFCFPLCHGAIADVLLIHEASDPIYGLIESQDAQHIRFAVYQVDTGAYLSREFSRASVRMAIRTVVPERLEQLSVKQLSGYRDYAEELSAYRKDPVARNMAIRLALICLYHAGSSRSDRELSASTATLLPSLANAEQEKRQFQLIADIYTRGLRSNKMAKDEAEQQSSVQRSLLMLVQLLRREQYDEARDVLAALPASIRLPGISISIPTLRSAISDRQIEPQLMRDLITAEIRLRSGPQPEAAFGDTLSEAKTWSNHQKAADEPIWIPSLTELTDHDLDKTQYQDGEWVRPSR